ncbi:C2 domain-containing protein, partial [Haematococcus lacustris]
RSVLRVVVKDVDPVPPDDDLGWAEVVLEDWLPAPGQVWEQWLPLEQGQNSTYPCVT